jgi:hypothetical protein
LPASSCFSLPFWQPAARRAALPPVRVPGRDALRRINMHCCRIILRLSAFGTRFAPPVAEEYRQAGWEEVVVGCCRLQIACRKSFHSAFRAVRVLSVHVHGQLVARRTALVAASRFRESPCGRRSGQARFFASGRTGMRDRADAETRRWGDTEMRSGKNIAFCV